MGHFHLPRTNPSLQIPCAARGLLGTLKREVYTPSTLNTLKVHTTQYGYNLGFDDELNIKEIPHAWVKKQKLPKLSSRELFPDSFLSRYTISQKGNLVVNKDYL